MKLVDELRESIDQFRLEPIEIFSESWEVSDNAEMAEWIKNHKRWIQIDDDTWEYADTEVGYLEISYNESADALATLTQYKKGTYRYMVYIALLVLPFALLAPSLLWGFILLLPISGAVPTFPSLLTEAPAHRVSRRMNRLSGMFLLGGMYSIAHWFAGQLPSKIYGITVTLVMILTFIWAYSLNALPFQSDDSYTVMLRVPLDLLKSAVYAIVLIYGGFASSLWMIHYFTQLINYTNNNPQAIDQALSEITRGSITSHLYVLDIFEASSTIWPLFAFSVTICVAILLNTKIFINASQLYKELTNVAIHKNISSEQWLFFAGMYIFIVFLALSIYFVGAGILWFGITGDWVLPTTLLTPSKSLLPPDFARSGQGILESLYQTYSTRFAEIGFLSGRVLITIGFSLIFLPAFLLILAIIVGLILTLKNWSNGSESTVAKLTEVSPPNDTDQSSHTLTYLPLLVLLPGGRNLLQVLDPDPVNREETVTLEWGLIGFFWRLIALYYGKSPVQITHLSRNKLP